MHDAWDDIKKEMTLGKVYQLFYINCNNMPSILLVFSVNVGGVMTLCALTREEYHELTSTLSFIKAARTKVPSIVNDLDEPTSFTTMGGDPHVSFYGYYNSKKPSSIYFKLNDGELIFASMHMSMFKKAQKRVKSLEQELLLALGCREYNGTQDPVAMVTFIDMADAADKPLYGFRSTKFPGYEYLFQMAADEFLHFEADTINYTCLDSFPKSIKTNGGIRKCDSFEEEKGIFSKFFSFFGF